MTVAVAKVALYFSQSGSLKTKRMALRSIQDRLKNRFNVAVAEVEHQDLWQRATLAVATVNTERAEAESTLRQAVRTIEDDRQGEVLDVQVDLY